MSAVDEKVNEVLRMMYNIVDIGRLFGKAEAYQHMFEVLRKSNLRTSNPKLVLNTICMSLDSSSDVLERGKNFIEESSHTMATQVDTLENVQEYGNIVAVSVCGHRNSIQPTRHL
jgi:hypothetical protein